MPYDMYESPFYCDIYDLKGHILVGRLYIDDSKDGQQMSDFVLAGFHSPVRKWKMFDKYWSKELSKGPIPIEYFKSTEAAGLNGQFCISKGWSRQLANDKVNNLSKIIKKYCETCFFVHVNPAEFREIMTPMKLMGGNTLFDKEAYHFLVAMLIQRFYDHMSTQEKKGKQHIVLDNQMGYEPLVTYLWDIMKRHVTLLGVPFANSPVVGNTPVHRNDKDNPGLQAADMIAWCIRRHHQGLRLSNKMPIEALNRLVAIHQVPLRVSRKAMESQRNLMLSNPSYIDVLNSMASTPYKIC